MLKAGKISHFPAFAVYNATKYMQNKISLGKNMSAAGAYPKFVLGSDFSKKKELTFLMNQEVQRNDDLVKQIGYEVRDRRQFTTRNFYNDLITSLRLF